jgi:2-amino-4-hydroxy-6-hydroxymethyldihydropteridine diphosphokinase
LLLRIYFPGKPHTQMEYRVRVFSFGVMNDVYILLGGNLGNRQAMLANARQAIARKLGVLTAQSAIYETAPWGVPEQPAYLNQVVVCQTAKTPMATLRALQAVEKMLGRKREEKWHARTIDIDILYFQQRIIDLPELTVPHPQIPNRRFTLVPLLEIAPDFIHPVLQQTHAKLLQDCPDPLWVKPFQPVATLL